MTELKKFDEPIELQRLRKLQILIETDMWFNKDVKLDMEVWANECGTTACLCGMYTMAYPNDGLEIIKDVYQDQRTGCARYRTAIKYKNRYDFPAARWFFGIDEKRANELFDLDEYLNYIDRDEEGYFDAKDILVEALKRVKRMIGEKVACLS